MSTALRKGWCPSLFEPMESGDGLIVRIKPQAATIEAPALRAIADAASRFGNGIVELTNRGNLQVRGVRAETLAPLTAMAARLRLVAADPAMERIRNVMASPLGPDDPGAAFDSHALALDIERMLAAEPAFAELPPKFGFVVDGGGAVPLADIAADIAIRPSSSGTDSDGEIIVDIAGGLAATACTRVEAVSTVRRLTLAFLELGRRSTVPPRRMRDLIRAVGADTVFAHAGLLAESRRTNLTAPTLPIGLVPLPVADGGAFGMGLPFGQIEAGTLAAVADFAERYGDGTLRTTPWRVLMIASVKRATAPSLAAGVEGLGLIGSPSDPRLRVIACPGKPACGNATVATRIDGVRLAARIGSTAGTIHLSGCAKGCAHAGAAAATLVGRDGRYDLVLDGGTMDSPAASGLTVDAAISLIERRARRAVG